MEITLKNILDVVCDVCELTKDQVKGKGKDADCSNARTLYCLLAKNWTNKTGDEVAWFIDKSNKSITSLHIKKSAKLIANEDENFLYIYRLAVKKLKIIQKEIR